MFGDKEWAKLFCIKDYRLIIVIIKILNKKNNNIFKDKRQSTNVKANLPYFLF